MSSENGPNLTGEPRSRNQNDLKRRCKTVGNVLRRKFGRSPSSDRSPKLTSPVVTDAPAGVVCTGFRRSTSTEQDINANAHESANAGAIASSSGHDNWRNPLDAVIPMPASTDARFQTSTSSSSNNPSSNVDHNWSFATTPERLVLPTILGSQRMQSAGYSPTVLNATASSLGNASGEASNGSIQHRLVPVPPGAAPQPPRRVRSTARTLAALPVPENIENVLPSQNSSNSSSGWSMAPCFPCFSSGRTSSESEDQGNFQSMPLRPLRLLVARETSLPSNQPLAINEAVISNNNNSRNIVALSRDFGNRLGLTNQDGAANQFSPVASGSGGAGLIADPYPVHTQVEYTHFLLPDMLNIVNAPYYWGVMDRFEAEKLLENKPEGTFLLRDSAQLDYMFSVSFRRYGRSLHARIEQLNHRFSFDSWDPGVFSSNTVTGLIDHYKNPAVCLFFEPQLSSPLKRNFVFSLQQICRATITNRLRSFDDIQRLHLPAALRNFLEEYHYKIPMRSKRI